MASTRQTSWESLWKVLRDEGNRRWNEGRWKEAYDWTDITLRILQHALPPVCPPPKTDVLPLVVPGTWEGLALLTKLPIQLAIVSNGFAKNQQPYITALGLSPHIPFVLGPDNTGYAKPDPRIFSSLEGPILAHIGDRPSHDVVAAKRAGIFAIQFRSGPTHEDRRDLLQSATILPDAAVQSLSEAALLLAKKIKVPFY